MEVSSLRRNQARGRTALCSATPAPLFTATRTVRRLIFYPHPRPELVFRHACTSLVSSAQERSARSLLSNCLTSQHDASRLHPAIKPAAHNLQSDCLNICTRSVPFQST